MSKYIDYFWKYLESKNIIDIWGLPGGAISDIISKKPTSISWNNVGHELQNGFLASVYGYYKKNVGILFTTTGPGIATSLSAYINAEAENLPLLLISTFNPITNDDFQWWNIKQIGATIGHFFYIENKEEFINKLHEAYDLARQNTGVMLLININILNQPAEIPDTINKQIQCNEFKLCRNKIVNKINIKFCNKKSLIVIGKGLFFNYEVLKQFILRNNLPYVTTWKQRYIIENSLYCGRLGSLGNHSANYAVIKASRILIIGDISEGLNSPFFLNKFTFRKLNKKSIVYLLNNKLVAENNNNINKTFVIENLDYILNRLNFCPKLTWIDTITNGINNLLFDLPRTSQLEKYIYSATQAYKKNNLNYAVTSGVGNHWYTLGKYLDISEPNLFESPTNWASIGIGLANGIGLYMATKKPVWIFEGDGGFLFGSTTFLYLLDNPNLPLTVSIFIDKTYSAVVQTYVSKQFTNNNSNSVSFSSWSKILPNSIIFTNENDYYNYLLLNPITDYVRYILLIINNDDLYGSLVYEININEKYILNAEKNNFNEMINAPYIL